MNGISFNVAADGPIDAASLQEWAAVPLTPALLTAAAEKRDQCHPDLITFSKKVFIPLTHLCRDVCHYCTFAHPPRPGEAVYLLPDQILKIARAGAEAGCKEALFTLGDRPEARYAAARDALADLGYGTTLEYLGAMAALVFKETGLLPHLNPGLMSVEDFQALRPHAVSMGIMLETASDRLSEKGGPHFGSPDKIPARRLQCLADAGRAQVPFTSGILIGIGETRLERLEALKALADIHAEYGHIQEIIIQNFRAKPGTQMAAAPEPDLEDLQWTVAMARLMFPADMNIQAPPNLSRGGLVALVEAGVNDWGGVSPVTPDFVNPEAPWPHLQDLAHETAAAGKQLHERLALYPEYTEAADRWLAPAMQTAVLQSIDGQGLPRLHDWAPGNVGAPADRDALDAPFAIPSNKPSPEIQSLIARAYNGDNLAEADITRLFMARGADAQSIAAAADALRRELTGDVVSYVVTRNINYTNICYFKCQFCAFSKGKLSENLRGRPYNLGHDEIARRTSEAWARGASEVCMQGGIHPEYTGDTYLDICRVVKEAVPGMHIHAFSPLEIYQGAHTLGLSLTDFLQRLKAAGLGSLPGTAAEILDDEVRQTLCPDKINTEQWLQVMEAAHTVGLRSTATIMFGHVDAYRHWARHLLRIKTLQQRTGGFTELVPLPFVHMEAPIYLKGRARKGPTYREALLMHAIARLVLHKDIPNIQTSWVKMGPDGVKACLNAGANDLGGTLMNETITRAAGAEHGQEMTPERMENTIHALGRTPRQRGTLYQTASNERITASFDAEDLTPIVTPHARKYARDAKTSKNALFRP